MGLRVLVVDDSSIVRKSLARTLQMINRPVESISEAEHGQQALDLLSANPATFDLIFLDINMPVMNGIQLLESLKEFGLLAKLKVIVVSTEGSELRVGQLRELGIAAQLRKPVRPETLTQTITSVLDGSLS